MKTSDFAIEFALATGPKIEGPLGYPGKRAFDIAMSIMLIAISAPLVLLLWLIVRADGGPGFFGHTRIGLNGRPFRCWKLRTMVPDAERKLRRILAQNPALASAWSRDFKLDNDPRVTWIGGMLRRTGLDEFPQLWNVLRGEMSLVGPRPIIREELSKYGPSAAVYLACRPGLTGPWQVEGRDQRVGYAQRVASDVRYARAPSAVRDFKLILATVGTFIRASGR